MCSSTMKAHRAGTGQSVAQIDGRRVLQPACNRVVIGRETGRPMKKLHDLKVNAAASPAISVASEEVEACDYGGQVVITSRPPVQTPKTVHRRSDDPKGLNSSAEKPVSPSAVLKSLKKSAQACAHVHAIPSLPAQQGKATAPGSIAAAQREQATFIRAQRKMKIAHYGRARERFLPQDEKRCSFITSLYVAYHDEEWGVPVHDDRMLFELMVMAGAQVGLDWTTILKKREDFRSAFAGFDPEVVAKFTEKQMAAICSRFRMDIARVRSVVDNANCILEVGSLDEYFWGFVNHRPISTRYSSCRNIPVKTSKSEAISKDMVRRGFRFAGSAVIHSFMQAAGLTNDHLLSCPRHRQLIQPNCAPPLPPPPHPPPHSIALSLSLRPPERTQWNTEGET
ncbi:unnamed protein product [Spirodela intermedia]|uniref:Uncharacterized protein n=1 Tax=Spirodela intermedia TaxID=51605 RepID=A0A7I8IK71_SPIIN|nr:unnamed protein product [Spirodela intermedia]CAA6658150.1 unnamed protein product [Spirodela intermedia]